ncbi:NlpC/P60 family protein [Sporosarcina siberiensis]|uniref:NlpC/P60 family protein n=1 Tax=Sporosarcina siberiensis TaxID=1365606 RepID=A0ABW4SEC1_9BACL
MLKRLISVLVVLLIVVIGIRMVFVKSVNEVVPSVNTSLVDDELISTSGLDTKTELPCYSPLERETYSINVPVTTLWKEPNQDREVDSYATSSVSNMKEWTEVMTLPEKQWLVGKIETQALYGQEVTILSKSGEWYEIAVKDQYTPKNKTGYPGWVPKNHIAQMSQNYAECKVAIVSEPSIEMYSDRTLKEHFIDVSFNTTLPIIEEDKELLHVQTPVDGVKFIRKSDVKIVASGAEVPKPTENDIVNTAKEFLGLPYLWAGTSGFGYDCSGFTYSVYKQHGITLPRDSTVQATSGTAVSIADLKPGDLMFYSHDKGKGNVHHVSMYIGEGLMIHSPNPKKTVEIVSIDLAQFKSEFSGARRYLK